MSGERPVETEKERSYSALHRALQALKQVMKSQLKPTGKGETSLRTLI